MKMQENKYSKVKNYILFLNQKIAVGTDSIVYSCIDTLNPDLDLAVKVINIQQLTGEEYHEKIKQIQNEITIFQKTSLNSDYIVQYVDAIRTSKNVYIFMEKANTNLQEYLQSQPNHILPEKRAITYFKQILEAYKTIQKNNIIHKDIKPANILITNNKVQLCDFGTSEILAQNSSINQQIEVNGTPYYRSPELLIDSKYATANSKSDIWSLGIILFEMLNGQKPWSGKSIKDYKFNIQNRPLHFYNNNISENIKQLIQQMLTLDVDTRITWDQLIQTRLSLLNQSHTI